MPFSPEYLGYLASIVIAISLTMSSLLKLRLINLAGAIMFIIYGLLIGAIPIVLLNCLTTSVNLYFLYRLFTTKAYFQLLKVNSRSEYLHRFLDFHQADIRRFIPAYRFEPSDDQLIVFILRDMVPAGLFIGECKQAGVFHVYLDYVIPQYRDFKIANYLYCSTQLFKEREIVRLVSSPNNQLHEKYLQRMGFQQDGDGINDRFYTLHLSA